MKSVYLTFLAAGLWAVVQPATAKEVTFDLAYATIRDVQRAVAAGALSYERLVELYQARIEAFDQAGPQLNAVVAMNPHAVKQARALDEERAASGLRSPVHGIPVVIKDLIDCTELPTTGGFKPFGRIYPPRDSAVVARLREAGAIILASVNVSNWFGNGYDETHIMGPSRNPYNADYGCSGSSSGTGAAMAAWFATVGLGTDTGSSVLGPSSACGLYGMIASEGMVSRAGVLPRGATQDRVGPMARSTADVTTLLGIISGWDAEDLSTSLAAGRYADETWIEQLDSRQLSAFRLGVIKEMIHEGPDHEAGLAIFEETVNRFASLGAFVLDPVLTGTDLKVNTLRAFGRTAEFEKLRIQNAYLKRLGDRFPWESMESFMHTVGLDKFSESMTVALTREPVETSPEFQARLTARRVMRQEVGRLIETRGLDALILPFRTIPAQKIGAPYHEEGSNNFASNAGLPTIVLPAGYTEGGLPINVQIIGKMGDDLKILTIAHLFEKGADVYRLPREVHRLKGEQFTYTLQ